MILTLEVTGPHAATLGRARQQEFGPEGGSIGRENSSTWVLPHTKVSGLHALITCKDSIFYIEDRSRNGVCLGSVENRLVRARPYPLRSGDCIYIDPYEIRVSLPRGPADDRLRPFAAPGRRLFEESSSLDGDRFTERHPPLSSAPELIPYDDTERAELDPLKLLGAPARQAPPSSVPSAKDLALGSPMEGHYRPPAPVPAPPPPVEWDPTAIPKDYDPLGAEDSLVIVPTPEVSLPASSEAPWQSVHPPIRLAVPEPRPPEREPPLHEISLFEEPARDQAKGRGGGDLAEVLAGAGLDKLAVTPELARDFGRILRVVVSGLIDVLRARQQIKDEFRIRTTQFRPADNNPLKFSADVDDALHNLLVKRNPAFLMPVEAFEDAFDDLRNHQIAMLAGMRVAFQSMLAQFDPDRLQEQFDRQLKKGSILGVPARLRYWELYRDTCDAILKDHEASFRRLFGEEFAKAYEDQLKRLKAALAVKPHAKPPARSGD